MNQPEQSVPGTAGPVELSARGRARRADILSTLLKAQRTRVRRRRVTRGAAVAGALGLVIAAVYAVPWATPGGVTPAPGRIAETPAPDPVITPGSRHLVSTDPGIVSRVSVTRAPSVRIVEDDELSLLLSQAGRRPGLIRVEGRTMLEQELVEAPKAGL